MSTPILQVEKLAKSFALPGKRTLEVLRDVNLSLATGESVSVQGESGSGKSTLLNCLAGLETADDGSIQWRIRDDEAVNVAQSSDSRLAELRSGFLGFIFQSHFLVPELNALENVILPSRFLRNRTGAKARGAQLLGRVGLGDRAKNRVEVLSGGERQRVAVARALMNKPKLVFADEPTGNLDETTSETVMNLLLHACREEGVALILVTHHPGFARRTDRALHLTAGILADQSVPG